MAKDKTNTKTKEKIQAYVVSKAAQDIEYVGWTKGKNGLLQKAMSVLIKGGAKVVDKKTLNVDNGKVTPVTDEQLAFLKSDSTFQRHQKAGFVVITTSKVAADKKAEEEPETRDKGSQLTAQDFINNNQKPPIVGGEE